MGITLQFEGRSATDGKVMAKERLERDDGLLPAQLSAWTSIDPTCGLF
jgi:hypothetical protein